MDTTTTTFQRPSDTARATVGATLEVVLPAGEDLAQTLKFFVEGLGFRIDVIFPADAPRVASLSHPDSAGLRIRLEPFDGDDGGGAGLLRLRSADGDGRTLTAPNGTRIRIDPLQRSLDDGAQHPPFEPQFALIRGRSADVGHAGRAGMHYRDLIPRSGRYIASLIAVPDGGPVKDWVHHHRIHFQFVYCRRGWVEVVYEGQGPPFRLEEGDLVLQPPGIRHRVLECSPGLQVIEVASPTLHETFADHDMTLPTAELSSPDRLFGGQKYVRSQASNASFKPLGQGFERRIFGLSEATGGRVEVEMVRACGGSELTLDPIAAELRLFCLLSGTTTVERQGERHTLEDADSVLLPPDEPVSFVECSTDFALLLVRSPA